MKRLLFIFAFVLLWSQAAFASIVVNSSNSNADGGGDTTLTVQLTTIAAGNLILCSAGNSTSHTMTISDGTSSLTGLTVSSAAGDRIQLFYLLSSVATGTVTYTVTYSGSAFSRFVGCFSFTTSATATFDQQNTDNNFSTTVTTGNITPAGSGDWVAIVGSFDEVFPYADPTSKQINGVAADGSVTNQDGHAWYRIVSSSFTGQGTATISNSRWVSAIASFNVAAGSAATPSGLLLRGVQ